jgi:hypothetical protein
VNEVHIVVDVRVNDFIFGASGDTVCGSMLIPAILEATIRRVYLPPAIYVGLALWPLVHVLGKKDGDCRPYLLFCQQTGFS